MVSSQIPSRYFVKFLICMRVSHGEATVIISIIVLEEALISSKGIQKQQLRYWIVRTGIKISMSMK